MTITEFVLARLAEDEAIARAAIDPDRPGTHWQWTDPEGGGESDPDPQRWLQTTEEFPTRSGVGPLPAFPLGVEFRASTARGMAHIARHDPARVLAECEAKRHIVEEHQVWQPTGYRFTDGRQIDVCTVDERHWPCPTMRAVASIWVEDPEYLQEWRIGTEAD